MKKKIHPVEKVLNWIMFFLFCYAGSSLDSVSWVPMILTIISMTYLIIVGIRYGVIGGVMEE